MCDRNVLRAHTASGVGNSCGVGACGQRRGAGAALHRYRVPTDRVRRNTAADASKCAAVGTAEAVHVRGHSGTGRQYRWIQELPTVQCAIGATIGISNNEHISAWDQPADGRRVGAERTRTGPSVAQRSSSAGCAHAHCGVRIAVARDHLRAVRAEDNRSRFCQGERGAGAAPVHVGEYIGVVADLQAGEIEDRRGEPTWTCPRMVVGSGAATHGHVDRSVAATGTAYVPTAGIAAHHTAHGEQAGLAHIETVVDRTTVRIGGGKHIHTGGQRADILRACTECAWAGPCIRVWANTAGNGRVHCAGSRTATSGGCDRAGDRQDRHRLCDGDVARDGATVGIGDGAGIATGGQVRCRSGGLHGSRVPRVGVRSGAAVHTYSSATGAVAEAEHIGLRADGST